MERVYEEQFLIVGARFPRPKGGGTPPLQKTMSVFHTPVLLKEAIEYLNIKPGEEYIDATLGGGGHSARIIELGGKVLSVRSRHRYDKLCSK